MSRPPTRASSRQAVVIDESPTRPQEQQQSSSTTSSTSQSKNVSGTKRSFDATVVVDESDDNNTSSTATATATTTTTTTTTATMVSNVNEDVATESRNAAEDSNTCAICLDRVIDQGLLNCCAHVFCFPCAKKWSESENTCPLCKQRFNSIVRLDLSNPGQQRRAEKIRVAQRNQSARLNAAAVLGPGMFLSSHMQAIVRLLWPGIASTNGRFSQYFRSAGGASSAPRETIDVDAAAASSSPSPPPPLPSLVRSVAEPPQIIDLTALDASDSDENAVVVQTIDLTQDDDDDAAAATPPHEDDPVLQVTVPLVSQ